VECQALLSEIQLMKQLDSHPHVVQMLACCTQGDTVAMVMDFFSNGNLRDFLVKSHNGSEVTVVASKFLAVHIIHIRLANLSETDGLPLHQLKDAKGFLSLG